MKDTDIEAIYLKAGDNLPEFKKEVLQEAINRYAEASGDYNPIHIDNEFAVKTPLGGTIAHGMLILAYITGMVGNVFGPRWSSNGSLSVRFKNPARPGDRLTFAGKVRTITDSVDMRLYTCDIRCSNQHDDTVVTGEICARLKLPAG